MTDFWPFALYDAVAFAAAALSHAADEAVRINSVLNLEKDQRRNLILRARAVRGEAKPRSIIIEATRAADYDAGVVNAYEASGLGKEWAATSDSMRQGSGHPFTPNLLVYNLKPGILVYDDVGDGLPSLAGSPKGRNGGL